MVDNHVQYASLSVGFQIIPAELVMGTSQILVEGGEFAVGVSLYCVFGKTLTTLGQWLSTTTMSCPLPRKLEPGVVAVSVAPSADQVMGREVSIISRPAVGSLTIRPNVALMSGNSELAIFGTNFYVGLHAPVCRFDFTIVSAQFISSNELRCIVPAVSKKKSSAVSISLNGGYDFIPATIPLDYIEDVNVSTISLSHSQAAKTWFYISGSGFIPHRKFPSHCRLNSDFVSAIHISDTQLSCFAGAHLSGDIQVVLFHNGSEIPGTFVNLDSRESLVVTQVTLTGQTSKPEVVVRGANFDRSARLRCVFDDTFTGPVQWVSSSQVRCPVNFSEYSHAPQRRFALVRALEIEPVTSCALIDGDFAFAEVSSLMIVSNPRTQGAIIRIHGLNFNEAQLVHCILDEKLLVIAFILSSNLAECHIPTTKPLNELATVEIESSGVTLFRERGGTLIVAQPTDAIVSRLIGGSVRFQNASTVTLSGIYPTDRDLFCVFGDGTVTRVGNASRTLAQCLLAIASGSKQTTLSVSTSASSFAQATIQIPISPRLLATSVFPMVVTTTTTTRFIVNGANFPNNIPLLCHFVHRASVPAEWISSEMVACASPPLTPGLLNLRIETSQGEIESQTLTIRVEIGPTPIAVIPGAVASNGGNEVVITGFGFESARNPSCRFGRTVVRAAFITSTKLSCVSPPLSLDGNKQLELSVSNDGMSFDGGSLLRRVSIPVLSDIIVNALLVGETTVYYFNTSFVQIDTFVRCHSAGESGYAIVTRNSRLSCSIPNSTFAHSEVCVEINRTRGAFWCGHVQLSAQLDAMVAKVWPQHMPALQVGREIRVIGGNFVQSNLLCCLVGGIKVPTSWISEQEVACKTRSHHVGRSQVQVLNDCANTEKENQGEPIEFISKPMTKYVQPEVLSLHSRTLITLHVGDMALVPLPVECIFDTATSVADIINDAGIICPTPDHVTAPQSSNLTVGWRSRGTAVMHDTRANIMLAPIPELQHISPVVAPIGFPGNFSIQGQRFRSSLWCLFGNVVWVEATVINFTHAVCAAPRVASSRTLSVQVSLNQAEVSPATHYIEFYQEPTILRVYPVIALAERVRETQFTITLSSGLRLRYSRPYCQFHGVRNVSSPLSTLATQISETEFSCLAPSAPPGLYAFGLVFADNGALHLSPMPINLIPTPVLYSITPNDGPSDGGTEITILGSNLMLSSAWKCRFGDVALPSSYVSETEVRCFTPPKNAGPQVLVTLSLDNCPQLNQWEIFSYTNHTIIHRIVPSLGPRIGGTLVTLIVAGIAGFEKVVCNFGGAETPASLVAPGEVQCVTLPNKAETIEVRISKNGVDYSNAISFEFFDAIHINSLDPRHGPVFGGTLVLVRGENFRRTPDLACNFGDKISHATSFVSSEAVYCVTPIFSEATVIPVTLTMNGLNFSSAHAYFEIVGIPEIHLVSISTGPPAGGTLVVIAGTHFTQPTHHLSCRFGSQVVGGMWLAKNLMLCITPPNLEGTYSVGISVNGGDYSKSDGQFTYKHRPVLSSIAPSYGYTNTRKLYVTGSHFVNSPNISCQFMAEGSTHLNIASATARYVSPTEVICFPPQQLTRTSQIRVAVDGNQFSRAQQQYQLLHSPYVMSVAPASGPEHGGTHIRFSGVNLIPSTNASCLFKNFLSPLHRQGNSHDNNAVWCMSPPGQPSNSTLSVTMNGIDLVGTFHFVYTEAPTVSFISPREGPESGGFVVRIIGSALGKLASATCRFDMTFVAAEIVNNNEMRCIAPYHFPGIVDFGLLSSSSGAPIKEEFKYLADIKVTKILPESGSVVGGTEVIVMGACFSGDLFCLFGDIPSAGVVISSQELRCISPTWLGPAERVSLSVKMTNGSLSSNKIYFHYQKPPIITTVTKGYSEGSERNVIVSGKNFIDSPWLTCKAGQHHCAHCKWLSASLIMAAIPLQLDTGASDTLSVSNNAVDFVSVKLDGLWPSDELSLPSAVSSVSAVDNASKVVASVLFINPIHGPTVGGTRLKIFLSDPPATYPFSCHFGAQRVDAFFESSDVATCLSPAAQTPGLVNFDFMIGNARLEVLEEPVTFKYYTAAHAHSLQPSTGIINGGTIIRVSATNLIPSGSLRCRFGEKAVPGMYINRHLLECLSPPSARAGTVDVSISIDGAYFGSSSSRYEYVDVPRVIQLSPSFGWSVGSGLVRAQLSSVPRHLNMCSCLFGSKEVRGYFVHSSELVCSVPPRLPTTLTFDKKVMVQIRCELNGSLVQFLPRQQFTYVDLVEVIKVEPSFGLELGGKSVKILGKVCLPNPYCSLNCMHPQNFPNNDGLRCFFGDAVVPATWISTSSITCASPLHAPGTVSVKVGFEYLRSENSFAVYTFKPAIRIPKIFPSSGGSIGGSVVTFYGTDLSLELELHCDFAGVKVPVVVLNHSAAQCVTPVHDPGMSNISILAHEEVVATFEYRFLDLPRVVAVIPSRGPVNGGTRVRVLGVKLVRDAQCCFGTSVRPAITFISSEEVVCKSPPAQEADDVRVLVSMCTQHTARTDGPVFHYVHAPLVTGVYPSYGPDSGGTIVTVTGDYFGATLESWCLFGNITSRANVLSASLLTCLSPARQSVTSRNVHVSIVDDDYALDTIPKEDKSALHAYTYQPSAVVTSVYPVRAPASGGTTIWISGLYFQVDIAKSLDRKY